MALKYLVIGSGYIGSYLGFHLPDCKVYKGYIDDEAVLRHLIDTEYPSHVIINCAGKTGRPNIDWCEDHKAQTFGANVGLPVMIAEVCTKLKRYWMHIGSGCIYDGYDKEYEETDAPDFTGSFYSKTKIWSQDILSEYAEACILRIRMPIDEDMQERNYISKIVKYSRLGRTLLSTPNSMTCLKDMMGAIQFLAEAGHTGTWNVVNQGGMTAKEVLDLYRKYMDKKLRYKIDSIENVTKNLKAGRSNCLLSGKKLAEAGFVMPELKGRIKDILLEKGLDNRKGK